MIRRLKFNIFRRLCIVIKLSTRNVKFETSQAEIFTASRPSNVYFWHWAVCNIINIAYNDIFSIEPAFKPDTQGSDWGIPSSKLNYANLFIPLIVCKHGGPLCLQNDTSPGNTCFILCRMT